MPFSLQERLVESGLEFFGDDEEAVFGLLKLLGGLPFGEAVHARFGVIQAVILHYAGERHQRPDGVALLFQIGVEGLLVQDGVQAAGSNHHRFCLPDAMRIGDFVARDFPEMLDHDGGLVRNGEAMQADVAFEQAEGFALFDARVFGDFFEQVEVGFVGGVVLQHVEDEIFFDGLPQGVEMERAEGAVGLLDAEQFERLLLGGGGEGEETQVGLTPARRHALVDEVFAARFGGFGCAIQPLGFFQRFGAQDFFEPFVGFAGLRGV